LKLINGIFFSILTCFILIISFTFSPVTAHSSIIEGDGLPIEDYIIMLINFFSETLQPLMTIGGQIIGGIVSGIILGIFLVPLSIGGSIIYSIAEVPMLANTILENWFGGDIFDIIDQVFKYFGMIGLAVFSVLYFGAVGLASIIAYLPLVVVNTLLVYTLTFIFTMANLLSSHPLTHELMSIF